MISRLLLFSFSTARFCSGGNMNIQPEIEILGAGSVIYSASSTSVDLGWYALDDVVMGGASKTNLNPGTKFDGVWTGYVTTAQNGGFAGIRTKPRIKSGCGKTLASMPKCKRRIRRALCTSCAPTIGKVAKTGPPAKPMEYWKGTSYHKFKVLVNPE